MKRHFKEFDGSDHSDSSNYSPPAKKRRLFEKDFEASRQASEPEAVLRSRIEAMEKATGLLGSSLFEKDFEASRPSDPETVLREKATGLFGPTRPQHKHHVIALGMEIKDFEAKNGKKPDQSELGKILLQHRKHEYQVELLANSLSKQQREDYDLSAAAKKVTDFIHREKREPDQSELDKILLQHRKADLISEDELNTAKIGFERFEKVVERASEDIRRFFLRGTTGEVIQAMYLGVKTVIFALTNYIIYDTCPPELQGHDDAYDDAFRTHLVEVMQTYKKITNHIRQTDTSDDIRVIDLAIRDYSCKDDPYIHTEGKVTLVEGDHSIYSYSSVKRLFNAHQDIFSLDDSDNSIKSIISEYTSEHVKDEKIYALVCGDPRYTVYEDCKTHRPKLVGIHLHGRTYMNKSGDERYNIDHIKDHGLFHRSGMGDFIEENRTDEEEGNSSHEENRTDEEEGNSSHEET